MASASLRDQDRLDGASNFGVWKARISLLLEENGIKDYVTSVVVVPIKHNLQHTRRTMPRQGG